MISTSRDRSTLKLKDVQQNDLVTSGQKTVPMLVGPTGGKHAMEATATFRVAEVRDNILSLGKLVRKGFSFNLGPGGCSMEKDGRKVPLYLARNSLRVEAHVLQRASRPGCVAAGTTVADERMDGVDVKESHSSSSSGPAEAGTTPAPVLKTWFTWTGSPNLRDEGCALPTVFCEYEQIAARKTKEEEHLESRRKELAAATEPVTPKILPGPIQPSEVERQHHLVNHLPPAPWCELCVMGRGKDDPHLRGDLREKGEQLPVIAFDFAFVKTTSASGETEQKYATTLVAVDADLFFVKVMPVLGKETSDCSATGLIKFIESFFHKHVRLRCDGEPATVALANKVKNMAGDLVKFETTPKHSSASILAERAIQAVEEQSRTIRADCQVRFGSSENFGADKPIWAWLLRHAG